MEEVTKLTDQYGNYWLREGDGVTWFLYEKSGKISLSTCATEIKRNNRGITLENWGITGERFTFTLKPSNWTFE